MAFPKRNTAFTFYTGLTSQTDPNLLQNTPTLAAGDVQVSKDGGSFVNLTNLPSTTPPAGKSVQVSLTATEMNADNIVVLFSDVAGAEWADQIIVIQTSLRSLDELMYPTYTLPDNAASDGTMPSIEQALYMINQYLQERIVTGTTVTVRKPDGSTTLMTFTLNDPVNPTSITRSA
jgi:hypothetical protein